MIEKLSLLSSSSDQVIKRPISLGKSNIDDVKIVIRSWENWATIHALRKCGVSTVIGPQWNPQS